MSSSASPPRRSSPVARVAAAEQVAFTNYLGASILMITLFYGYGFGLFGQLSRWQVYLVPPSSGC